MFYKKIRLMDFYDFLRESTILLFTIAKKNVYTYNGKKVRHNICT